MVGLEWGNFCHSLRLFNRAEEKGCPWTRQKEMRRLATAAWHRCN
jgi:hypothetical protein